MTTSQDWWRQNRATTGRSSSLSWHAAGRTASPTAGGAGSGEQRLHSSTAGPTRQLDKDGGAGPVSEVRPEALVGDSGFDGTAQGVDGVKTRLRLRREDIWEAEEISGA